MIEYLSYGSVQDFAESFRQGRQQDYAEVIRWYRKAADQGNADAQNNLGSMYRDGEGIQDLAGLVIPVQVAGFTPVRGVGRTQVRAAAHTLVQAAVPIPAQAAGLTPVQVAGFTLVQAVGRTLVPAAAHTLVQGVEHILVLEDLVIQARAAGTPTHGTAQTQTANDCRRS